ncbi:MAG: DUF4317 family protein [Oscillibacter sp.]|nr:DUF4317 family protein [Oscillibacter sp.]
MNRKEINELRRRFRPGRSAVSRVYGCYVNGVGEIVSYIDTPLGRLSEEENEMYLGLLKRVLSGTMGKNLIDVVFTTKQVAEGDEHRLLSDLRSSNLENAEAREIFYQKAVSSLHLGDNGYLLLLASDAYDVPYRGKDDEEQADASENVYRYIVCAVCPIKDPTTALRYFRDANEFHSETTGQTVDNTALGFVFPAFDDRAANLYNALYYVRRPGEVHQEFVDAVFATDAPMMSAEEQREAFHNAMTQSLGDECGFDLLQTVHEQLKERIDQHRKDKDPEPLGLTAREVGDILTSGGVSREKREAFEFACGEHFGENVVLNPENVIDSKRFEILTPEAKISVDPSCSYMVETRIIDGRRYLLIPAGHDVTVNGIPVTELPDAGTVADAASLAVGLAPETDGAADGSGGMEDADSPETADNSDSAADTEAADTSDDAESAKAGETAADTEAENPETAENRDGAASPAAEDDTPPWE